MSTSSTPKASNKPLAVSEPELLAEQGTFVVFSLATDILHDANPNPRVREALKLFSPRKYLGLVLSEYSYNLGLGEIQQLRIALVGTCYPQADYARRKGVPALSWMYEHNFLSLQPSAGPGGHDRPVLNPQPPLPWNDCVVHTVHEVRCEAGRLRAHSDPWEVSPRDIEQIENWLQEDFWKRTQIIEAWEKGDTSLEQNIASNLRAIPHPVYRAAASAYPPEVVEEMSRERGRHYTGFDHAVEDELFQRHGERPDWRIVVNLSEDLSELWRVPYPGDFREECVQLKHLMDLAWEQLPYDNVLSKWPRLDEELSDWNDYPSGSDRDDLSSISTSTSGRSLSPVSTHSYFSEALIPLPESPRFEELPDDYVPEEGVTVSRSEPETQLALISRAPALPSTFSGGIGLGCGAMRYDHATAPRTIAILPDISVGTTATSTLPEAVVPLPESPRIEEYSSERVEDDGGALPLESSEATDGLVEDVSHLSTVPLSDGSGTLGSVRFNTAHDHEAADKASGSDSVPGRFRKKRAKLTSAAREVTQKAASCVLRTSRAVRSRISALVKTAGRCGRHVVHEVVRCIVEPL